MRLSTFAALVCAAVAGARAATGAGDQPNIVVLLADDYGWANFGPHRTADATPAERQALKEVHTPTLDALAAEGVLLERHYGYKQCSPARSALQSGRLPVHVNIENISPSVVNASDPVSGFQGIPRNMTGMAEKLRDAGYQTRMAGKWDAGMATPQHTPLGRGYQEWLGYYQHANDYWTKGVEIDATGELNNCWNHFRDLSSHNATYRGGAAGPALDSGCRTSRARDPPCYEEALFKAHALQTIAKHDPALGPLFYLHSFHLLHTPLQVPEWYMEAAARRVAPAAFDDPARQRYAAMAHYLDDTVGAIVGALKDRGLWDNTVLVFLTDNGGPIYIGGAANNYPLKGGKLSDWEGGVRTNALVAGGALPSAARGSRYSGLVSIGDWLGIFCDLAGADPTDHKARAANEWLAARGLPLLPAVDYTPGLWAAITAARSANATILRPTLHLSPTALIRWPFKLVTGRQLYSGWTGPLYPNCSGAGDGKPAAGVVAVFNVAINVTTALPDLWPRECGAGCLYDIQADEAEHRDLASDPQYAGVVASMEAELAELNRSVFRPGRGAPSAAVCLAALTNGGFYGPFVDAADWYTNPPDVNRTLLERAKLKAERSYYEAINSPSFVSVLIKEARKQLPKVAKKAIAKLDPCQTPNSTAALLDMDAELRTIGSATAVA